MSDPSLLSSPPTRPYCRIRCSVWRGGPPWDSLAQGRLRGMAQAISSLRFRRRTETPLQPTLNPVFEATVQATEEAIVNAMVGAETMRGAHGSVVTALPHDQLQSVLRKY